MSLLGKFFAVPFLIIGTIVGGATLVVLLFAGPATSQQYSIEDLLRALESGTGEKSMGLLLPREKELWQMGLELSLRLGHGDGEAELTDEELQSVARRLGAMVRNDLQHWDRHGTSRTQPANREAVRSRRLEFLIQALARTQRPEAIAPLLEVVGGGREPYVTTAMRELAELAAIPESRGAIEPIVGVLTASTRAETSLMACTVLSVLAGPNDQHVIDALAAVRLASDGEVAWSAAIALARLGSDAGKSTLLDLLDRPFLESEKRYRVTDAAGNIRRYRLPPGRVDGLLIAAMEAASNLDDPKVWDRIAQLESDPSSAVRGRAAALLKGRLE